MPQMPSPRGPVATTLLAVGTTLAAMGLGLLACVWLNPMGLMFLAEFRVENRTTQPIWVTPVGTVGRHGPTSKHLLPLSWSNNASLYRSKRGDFEIQPGSEISLVYDWDDINFSEILVRDAQGQSHLLIVDPDPQRTMYSPPRSTHFVISNLATLGPPTREILEAHKRELRSWRFRILESILVAPFFAFCAAVWFFRRRLLSHPAEATV